MVREDHGPGRRAPVIAGECVVESGRRSGHVLFVACGDDKALSLSVPRVREIAPHLLRIDACRRRSLVFSDSQRHNMTCSAFSSVVMKEMVGLLDCSLGTECGNTGKDAVIATDLSRRSTRRCCHTETVTSSRAGIAEAHGGKPVSIVSLYPGTADDDAMITMASAWGVSHQQGVPATRAGNDGDAIANLLAITRNRDVPWTFGLQPLPYAVGPEVDTGQCNCWDRDECADEDPTDACIMCEREEANPICGGSELASSVGNLWWNESVVKALRNVRGVVHIMNCCHYLCGITRVEAGFYSFLGAYCGHALDAVWGTKTRTTSDRAHQHGLAFPNMRPLVLGKLIPWLNSENLCLVASRILSQLRSNGRYCRWIYDTTKGDALHQRGGSDAARIRLRYTPEFCWCLSVLGDSLRKGMLLRNIWKRRIESGSSCAALLSVGQLGPLTPGDPLTGSSSSDFVEVDAPAVAVGFCGQERLSVRSVDGNGPNRPSVYYVDVEGHDGDGASGVPMMICSISMREMRRYLIAQCVGDVHAWESNVLLRAMHATGLKEVVTRSELDRIKGRVDAVGPLVVANGSKMPWKHPPVGERVFSPEGWMCSSWLLAVPPCEDLVSVAWASVKASDGDPRCELCSNGVFGACDVVWNYGCDRRTLCHAHAMAVVFADLAWTAHHRMMCSTFGGNKEIGAEMKRWQLERALNRLCEEQLQCAQLTVSARQPSANWVSPWLASGALLRVRTLSLPHGSFTALKKFNTALETLIVGSIARAVSQPALTKRGVAVDFLDGEQGEGRQEWVVAEPVDVDLILKDRDYAEIDRCRILCCLFAPLRMLTVDSALAALLFGGGTTKTGAGIGRPRPAPPGSSSEWQSDKTTGLLWMRMGRWSVEDRGVSVPLYSAALATIASPGPIADGRAALERCRALTVRALSISCPTLRGSMEALASGLVRDARGEEGIGLKRGFHHLMQSWAVGASKLPWEEREEVVVDACDFATRMRAASGNFATQRRDVVGGGRTLGGSAVVKTGLINDVIAGVMALLIVGQTTMPASIVADISDYVAASHEEVRDATSSVTRGGKKVVRRCLANFDEDDEHKTFVQEKVLMQGLWYEKMDLSRSVDVSALRICLRSGFQFLRAVKLRDCALTMRSLASVCEVVVGIAELSALDISCNGRDVLSDEDLDTIADENWAKKVLGHLVKLLKSSTSMRSLDASHIPLGHEGQRCADLLLASGGLHHLRLCNCGLSLGFMRGVGRARSAAAGITSSVRVIDLSCNPGVGACRDCYMSDLCQYMGETHSHLEALYMGGCGLRDVHAEALCHVLKPEHAMGTNRDDLRTSRISDVEFGGILLDFDDEKAGSSTFETRERTIWRLGVTLPLDVSPQSGGKLVKPSMMWGEVLGCDSFCDDSDFKPSRSMRSFGRIDNVRALLCTMTSLGIVKIISAITAWVEVIGSRPDGDGAVDSAWLESIRCVGSWCDSAVAEKWGRLLDACFSRVKKAMDMRGTKTKMPTTLGCVDLRGWPCSRDIVSVFLHRMQRGYSLMQELKRTGALDTQNWNTACLWRVLLRQEASRDHDEDDRLVGESILVGLARPLGPSHTQSALVAVQAPPQHAGPAAVETRREEEETDTIGRPQQGVDAIPKEAGAQWPRLPEQPIGISPPTLVQQSIMSSVYGTEVDSQGPKSRYQAFPSYKKSTKHVEVEHEASRAITAAASHGYSAFHIPRTVDRALRRSSVRASPDDCRHTTDSALGDDMLDRSYSMKAPTKTSTKNGTHRLPVRSAVDQPYVASSRSRSHGNERLRRNASPKFNADQLWKGTYSSGKTELLPLKHRRSESPRSYSVGTMRPSLPRAGGAASTGPPLAQSLPRTSGVASAGTPLGQTSQLEALLRQQFSSEVPASQQRSRKNAESPHAHQEEGGIAAFRAFLRNRGSLDDNGKSFVLPRV